MQFKTRSYTILQADAAAGLELTPANLGFNPSHGYRKAQITTNDFGGGAGEISVSFKPVGSDSYYPFQLTETPIGGTDIVIIGRDDDPLFEAIKIEFANVTGDIELNVGFIWPEGDAK